jgi:isopentenyl-diphosphate delta-isomerase type 1
MTDQEVVDIIDENNNVIGREPKEVCFEKGLLHRAVHILLFNSSGQLLLQKRGRKKFYPGYWTSSVSGHVASGETYEQAAAREMKEEVGVSVHVNAVCDFLGEETYSNLVERERIRLFIGTCEGPFRLQREEVADAKFFDLGDVEKRAQEGRGKFTPNLILSLTMYSKHFKRPAGW